MCVCVRAVCTGVKGRGGIQYLPAGALGSALACVRVCARSLVCVCASPPPCVATCVVRPRPLIGPGRTQITSEFDVSISL